MKKIGKLFAFTAACLAAAAAVYCLILKRKDTVAPDAQEPEDDSYVEPAEPGLQREYVSLRQTEEAPEEA